ncbi:MAG: hypothetical protein KDK23_07935, partial [Leptospiraceae bacterium]|nr:hypothetical protein [Leptospiraceae bacterium]
MEYPFYSRSRLQSSLKARNAAILKSKGQNFLIDPNSVRKIADTVFALLDELSDSSAAQGKGDAKTDTDNSRDSQRPAGAGAATRPVAEGTTGESKPAPIELWEIGPGTGALSHVIWQGLQKRAALEPQREFRWLGIELDPVLCDILKTETFP